MKPAIINVAPKMSVGETVTLTQLVRVKVSMKTLRC